MKCQLRAADLPPGPDPLRVDFFAELRNFSEIPVSKQLNPPKHPHWGASHSKSHHKLSQPHLNPISMWRF